MTAQIMPFGSGDISWLRKADRPMADAILGYLGRNFVTSYLFKNFSEDPLAENINIAGIFNGPKEYLAKVKAGLGSLESFSSALGGRYSVINTAFERESPYNQIFLHEFSFNPKNGLFLRKRKPIYVGLGYKESFDKLLEKICEREEVE